MPTILLVEDDPSLGRTLAERLEKERMTVEWVQTIGDAAARVQSGAWDLAILDVRLPDGSGFDLARRIRSSTTIPIMFMTALNSAENRLEGFEIGADEYLPKPFHLKEFMIRVGAVLSRPRATRVLRVNGFALDLDAMSVDAPDGRRTFLQVRDHRVLQLLIDAAPRVVDRATLLDQAWGEDQFPTARAVDNAIMRLRQVLGDEHGTIIRSVRGVGYQWAGETSDQRG
jgi:two-component system, OmpR family, phosphate regulon response regulator PhoB